MLIFPWRDWNTIKREGFRTREANILQEIIKDSNVEKVLCVNRSIIPKYLMPVIKKLKPGFFELDNVNTSEIIESTEYKRTFSELKKINDKFYVLDLNYMLPNPKGNKLERIFIFNKILENEIRIAIEYLKLNNYSTMCWDVTRVEIANKYKGKLLIFDVIDNLLEHDQNKKDRNFLEKCYEKINNTSNIIFTVSKSLKDTLFKNHNNTHFIPNGINLDLYKKNDTKKLADLPIGKPIVGYVGLMQERIDIELLEYIIEENQNKNFVFIGPVLSPSYFNSIKEFKNVFFLGSKHHSQIVDYIYGFDVCIIPHKVNEFTKSMNPLKLYEYLAAGKQVITTPVPPSDDFEKVIYIAKDKEEFNYYINESISTPYSKFSKESLGLEIEGHSWSNRYYEMKSKIYQDKG